MQKRDSYLFPDYGRRQAKDYTIGCIAIFLITLAITISAFPGLKKAIYSLLPVNVQQYTLLNVPFFFFLASLYFINRYWHARTFLSLFTYRRKISWRKFFYAFFFWFLLSALASCIEYLQQPSAYNRQETNVYFWLVFVLFASCVTAVQITTEELFVRSYLAQFTASLSSKTSIIILAPSLLFMAMHLNNPELEKGMWAMLAFYFSFAAFLAYLANKEGSIEYPLGIHFANNLFNISILNYKGSALSSPSLFVTKRFEPQISLLVFVVMAGIFYSITYFYKQKKM
ncbi:MAG: type II CAAX endopeptidase family protein [Spirochaetota bacterium]